MGVTIPVSWAKQPAQDSKTLDFFLTLTGLIPNLPPGKSQVCPFLLCSHVHILVPATILSHLASWSNFSSELFSPMLPVGISHGYSDCALFFFLIFIYLAALVLVVARRIFSLY